MNMRSSQPIVRAPKMARTFTPAAPDMYVVQLHEHDCTCGACRPHGPSSSDQLTARHMGILATLGALVGTGIAFVIDPAGAAAALLATIGL